MPFAIFETDRASLYIGSHDAQKREGGHLIVRHPGRNASGFLPENIEPELSCSHIYRVRLEPGSRATVGNLVLAIAPGGWHAYKNLYRRWHLKHFPPRPRHRRLNRYDGWQHKALILNDGRVWNTFRELPQLYQKLNETTGLTCLMIYGHTEDGADVSEPDVEPAPRAGGLREFQKALREIHARGGQVFVMTKANRASPRAPEWKKQWSKSIIKDEWGVERWVGWQVEGGWEQGGRGRPNAGMCLFDPRWRQFIAKRLSRLARIGVDGIQLDELCDRSACHNPAHRHRDPAVEFFSGLRQTLETTRRECRKFNPQIIIGGEELSDCDFHWLDLSYSRWSCPNTETGVTRGRIFRYYLPEAITHTRIQSYEIDQLNYALLLGTPVDIEVNSLRTMIYEWPLELERVQQVLSVRRRHARFFYQGTYLDTQHFNLRAGQAVHHGSHRARNGDDLLVVINRSDQHATVRIEPQGSYARYKVLPGAGGRVKELRSLDRKLVVRAHDFLVVECLRRNVPARAGRRGRG